MILLAMNWPHWEAHFQTFLAAQMAADAAHDLSHVRRVVANARRLARACGAELAIVLPAAWLHDCVVVPKDSPERPRASQLAAETAVSFLRSIHYPEQHLEAIGQAIAAHSFSAAILPETLEAQVVQDADRLDALGAIGAARTFAVGGAMGQPLYEEADPFCAARPPDDAVSTLDHFYTKLLTLAGTMQTAVGRQEAEQRTAFLHQFLSQLGQEIGHELHPGGGEGPGI
jgi:uncharacterized protein